MKTRRTTTKELDTIYLMGFDSWGNGETVDKYLARCYTSPKYKIGKWFVLEKRGTIVASLIVYKDTLNLAANCFGIGSLTTAKNHRNKGYASLLVSQVCQILQSEKGIAVYLFSDIGPDFYQRLGFEQVKDVCMVKKLVPNINLSLDIPSGF